MKRKPWRRLAASALCAIAGAACAAPRYQLVDLGWQNWPFQVNDHGQIAGQYEQGVAARYAGGRWKLLPNAYADSSAVAINRRGDVTGNGDSSIPLRWPRGGAVQQLEMPADVQFGWGNGIADDGTVVGSWVGTDDAYHCVEWPGMGTAAVDLRPDTPGVACQAVAVNHHGQIAGQAATVAGPRAPLHAFVYQGGRFRRLGHVPGFDQTVIHGLNALGHVVGGAEDTSYRRPSTPFFFDGRQMISLGRLAPDAEFEASAINDLDQIVGWGVSAAGTDQAALYEDGQWIPLESLTDGLGAWQLQRAFSINGAGVIVGLGQGPDGLPHGYELVPLTTPAARPR